MIKKILERNNFELVHKALEMEFANDKKAMLELKEFFEYYELNRDCFINKILSKKYETDIVKLNDTIDYNGKRTIVSTLSIKDTVVSYAVMRVLYEKYSKGLKENMFDSQQKNDVMLEFEIIKKYILDKSEVVAKIDIQDLLQNIDHYILLEKLKKFDIDEITLNLIEKFLACKIQYDDIISKKINGIIRENPLSSVLFNIYLDDFDKKLKDDSFKFVRVSDYIFVFDVNKKELLDKINYIKELLHNDLKFKVDERKIIIDKVENIEYCGYKLVKENNQINFFKKQRNKEKYYNFWKSSSIRSENNEYHIINDGILSRDDFSILFENKDKKKYLPVEVTSSINIYSNVIMSSSFFDYMNDKNILVNFFNRNGVYIGKFIPKSSRKSALTVLNQVKIYNKPVERMELAKNIIKSGIYNLITNMKYYNRRYDLKIDDKIKKIEELKKEIEGIEEYNKLLLTEARIREIYYSSFNSIIKNEEFYFEKRTKRPPKDRINSLISFGNALLYNFIAKEIYKTTLDIRIAYLHASNNRYESLNLDIADIFKPVIVDKIIFSLINKKIINSDAHFEVTKNSVYLNSEGKQIFIKAFYNKLKEAVQYNNSVMTYEGIIRKEIYGLLNHINGTGKYKAFRYY